MVRETGLPCLVVCLGVPAGTPAGAGLAGLGRTGGGLLTVSCFGTGFLPVTFRHSRRPAANGSANARIAASFGTLMRRRARRPGVADGRWRFGRRGGVLVPFGPGGEPAGRFSGRRTRRTPPGRARRPGCAGGVPPGPVVLRGRAILPGRGPALPGRCSKPGLRPAPPLPPAVPAAGFRPLLVRPGDALPPAGRLRRPIGEPPARFGRDPAGVPGRLLRPLLRAGLGLGSRHRRPLLFIPSLRLSQCHPAHSASAAAAAPRTSAAVRS